MASKIVSDKSASEKELLVEDSESSQKFPATPLLSGDKANLKIVEESKKNSASIVSQGADQEGRALL